MIKISKRASSFDDLTNELKKLVHETFKEIPSELDLAICQSLMRDFSCGDESRLKLYSAWLQKTKETLI